MFVFVWCRDVPRSGGGVRDRWGAKDSRQDSCGCGGCSCGRSLPEARPLAAASAHSVGHGRRLCPRGPRLLGCHCSVLARAGSEPALRWTRGECPHKHKLPLVLNLIIVTKIFKHFYCMNALLSLWLIFKIVKKGHAISLNFQTVGEYTSLIF